MYICMILYINWIIYIYTYIIDIHVWKHGFKTTRHEIVDGTIVTRIDVETKGFTVRNMVCTWWVFHIYVSVERRPWAWACVFLVGKFLKKTTNGHLVLSVEHSILDKRNAFWLAKPVNRWLMSWVIVWLTWSNIIPYPTRSGLFSTGIKVRSKG